VLQVFLSYQQLSKETTEKRKGKHFQLLNEKIEQQQFSPFEEETAKINLECNFTK
jgi:hypothetical protein